MFYRIPDCHVESFEPFFNRLVLWEDFSVLPASIDPDAPAPTSSTEIYCGFLNHEFRPLHVDSYLSVDNGVRRTVLLSRCKTMLIAYRLLGRGLYEATLYRDTTEKIKAIYRSYRDLVPHFTARFERTAMAC